MASWPTTEVAREGASNAATRVEAERFAADTPRAASIDEVATEEPLEVRIAGEALFVTMRTPGHDHELVAGLLLSEGLIESKSDLGRMAHCGRPGEAGWGNVIDVAPGPGVVIETERIVRRGTLTTAACGVCGRQTIDDLLARCPPVTDDKKLPRSMLAALPERLQAGQPGFSRTGGLHAAALADAQGTLLAIREDIGRHNAVDKVVGRALLDDRLPASGSALVVSGRTSFEIVQKALVARVSAVVAISAPSSLAVATARRAGLTLVGFARDGQFNAYAGAERISD